MGLALKSNSNTTVSAAVLIPLSCVDLEHSMVSSEIYMYEPCYSHKIGGRRSRQHNTYPPVRKVDVEIFLDVI
jgi:hypothetical protein